MKKRQFSILLALGISLVFISFALVIASEIREHIGSKKCQEVVSEINALLPDKNTGIPEMYPNTYMPVLEIDSVDYVAMLEIPSFSVTLPVADRWSKGQLLDTPARFYGSTYDHCLVIGGGDSSHQFSFCDKIDIGAIITVTDMTGAQFSYAVSRVDRSQSADSQWLIQKEYDLTLFMKNRYSMDYIAVRCKSLYQ